MKTLKGKVVCQKIGTDVEIHPEINPKSIITVQISDVSLMDAPSRKIASTELKGLTSFPFEFALTFDDAKIRENPYNSFAVSIRIEADGQLDFINDTRFEATKGPGELLDHIDMFVIPVVKFKTMTGRIVCKKVGTGELIAPAINPKANILVEIVDVSVADARSRTVGWTQVTGKSNFPVGFSFSYDDTPIRENPHKTFAVSVRIETDGKLEFINDTRFEATKAPGEALDHIEMFVIPVNH